MEHSETTITDTEALHISAVIKRILLKADKLFGNRYYKISIQLQAEEPHIIGHEEQPYKADYEQKLCKVTELLKGL